MNKIRPEVGNKNPNKELNFLTFIFHRRFIMPIVECGFFVLFTIIFKKGKQSRRISSGYESDTAAFMRTISRFLYAENV